MHVQRAVVWAIVALAGCGDTTVVPSLPVAAAGFDRTVSPGSEVRLDGSASYDPGGADLSYVWSLLVQPTGSTATLVGEATEEAKITPDHAGSYVVSLTVSNGKRDSVPDRVTITAVTQQPQLVAVASCVGGCDVQHGELGTVSARNTYGGSGTYSYAWDQITTASDCATRCPEIAGCNPLPNSVSWQSDNADRAIFQPWCNVFGSLVLEVTVNDGTSTDTACVEVAAVNTAPVANVTFSGLLTGPLRIDDTETFQLFGTYSSDADVACDDNDLTYQWVQLAPSSPLAAFQTDTDETTDVTVPNVGATTSFTFALVVSDGTESSDDPCTNILPNEGGCGIEVSVIDANP